MMDQIRDYATLRIPAHVYGTGIDADVMGATAWWTRRQCLGEVIKGQKVVSTVSSIALKHNKRFDEKQTCSMAPSHLPQRKAPVYPYDVSGCQCVKSKHP